MATCALELELKSQFTLLERTTKTLVEINTTTTTASIRSRIHVRQLFTVDVLLNLTLAAFPESDRVESAKMSQGRIAHSIWLIIWTTFEQAANSKCSFPQFPSELNGFRKAVQNVTVTDAVLCLISLQGARRSLSLLCETSSGCGRDVTGSHGYQHKNSHVKPRGYLNTRWPWTRRTDQEG